MRANLWILAMWIIAALGWPSRAGAGNLQSLPILGTTDQKPAVDTRMAVIIQNTCGKWVLVRVSPFAREESNLAKFKIRVPVGTDILTGSRKGDEDNLIFTIKQEHRGQILDVCG